MHVGQIGHGSRTSGVLQGKKAVVSLGAIGNDAEASLKGFGGLRLGFSGVHEERTYKNR